MGLGSLAAMDSRGNILNKAGRLAELARIGLNVPPFDVVPGGSVPEARRYAVRSNADVEDGDASAHAGQFLTLLDVKPAELSAAIEKVRASGSASVIVQEFVEPDFAGVAFTRSPLGGREMVIEWHAGRGADVVGGKVQPRTERFYWTQKPPARFAAAVESFKKIEAHFGFPQDVEWCVRNGVWFFLQTRPITSISKKEYEGMLFLDRTLPTDRPFRYEKTEVSEFAPRPTATMMELLKKIYGPDGPIERAYRRHGVRYRPGPFLVLVGSQLYVDRNAERRTLFPNFLTTMRNSVALSRIRPSLSDAKRQLETLERALSGDFLKDYETIFDINLQTAAAFKRKEDVETWEKLRTRGRKITEKYLGPPERASDEEPNFPATLSHRPISPDEHKPRGISPGIAEGILTDGKKLTGRPIVATDILAPELADKLGRIAGIIAERGGELSHLAITARESGVPVVVNASPRALGIPLGAHVRINGTTGDITRIS